MFKTPASVAQLIVYRRKWSTVYIISSLLLVFAGMVARVETLYCRWQTELLRLLPAALCAAGLVFVKQRKLYVQLIKRSNIFPLFLFGMLLLIGNSLLPLHTPPQVGAQLFLLATFSFTCLCIQGIDASGLFRIVLISACPFFAYGSFTGGMICLIPGLGILYRTCTETCRDLDSPYKLSRREVLFGIIVCIVTIAVSLLFHFDTVVDSLKMMVSAQNTLRNMIPLGYSRYLGIWAIHCYYPMGWDTTGYLSTVLGHCMGWVPMTVVFLIMTVWLFSGFRLSVNPYYSASDCFIRFAAKVGWAGLAIPAILFMLQNLGLAPHTDAIAPFFSRNILAQVMSVFLSSLLLRSGDPETELNPKKSEPVPENTNVISIVGERTQGRRAA